MIGQLGDGERVSFPVEGIDGGNDAALIDYEKLGPDAAFAVPAVRFQC